MKKENPEREPTVHESNCAVTIERIVSGGQTGADRAALDFARRRGIPHGGWCPAGRKAEDGPIDPGYSLKEAPTGSYSQRTEWNVRDSNGTVVFTIKERAKGGSKTTIDFARKYGKPWLHLAANRTRPDHAASLRSFIAMHSFKTLNVAGSRESEEPGIGRFVTATLRGALAARIAPGRILRILVVDDDVDLREFYKRLLERAFQVFESANSEDALSIAKQRRIDVVITDFVRPGKFDGLQFTRIMKKLHPTIPVLMATSIDENFSKEAFKAGAHSFLEKPFAAEVLLRVLDHVLSDIPVAITLAKNPI